MGGLSGLTARGSTVVHPCVNGICVVHNLPIFPEGPGGKVPISIYMVVIMLQEIGSHPQQVYVGEPIPGEPHVALSRACSLEASDTLTMASGSIQFLLCPFFLPLHWFSQ